MSPLVASRHLVKSAISHRTSTQRLMPKLTFGGDVAVPSSLPSLVGVLCRGRRHLSCLLATSTKEHVADSVSDDRTGYRATHGRCCLGEQPRLPALGLCASLGEGLCRRVLSRVGGAVGGAGLLLLWMGGSGWPRGGSGGRSGLIVSSAL